MLSLTNLKSLIIGSNLFGGSGVGDCPELYQAVCWGQKNQSMALLIIGFPHGDGDDPRTPPRCMEGGLEKVPDLICLTMSLL